LLLRANGMRDFAAYLCVPNSEPNIDLYVDPDWGFERTAGANGAKV